MAATEDYSNATRPRRNGFSPNQTQALDCAFRAWSVPIEFHPAPVYFSSDEEDVDYLSVLQRPIAAESAIFYEIMVFVDIYNH